MTEAIQTIRAMMPEAFWSHSARIWRRAADALQGSVLARVRSRRLTTLRVSDAWLRENEAAEAKRQDEAG
jgi:hypothetical protein